MSSCPHSVMQFLVRASYACCVLMWGGVSCWCVSRAIIVITWLRLYLQALSTVLLFFSLKLEISSKMFWVYVNNLTLSNVYSWVSVSTDDLLLSCYYYGYKVVNIFNSIISYTFINWYSIVRKSSSSISLVVCLLIFNMGLWNFILFNRL